MEITTLRERKRGCGFRKEGGLYVVSGQPAKPCGKLPLLLEVCPVCRQGIKPARGWTWVNGEILFSGLPCSLVDINGCKFCVLHSDNAHQIEKCGLLWIGEKYYATPAKWKAEAISMGISRRISTIPKDFKLGETWILIAHRKVDVGDKEKPAIFSAFKPEKIEYVVKKKDTKKKLKKLVKRGVTLVKIEKIDENGNLFE